MPSESGSIDLSKISQEDREAVAALAEQNKDAVQPEKPTMLTAFGVVVDTAGNPQIVTFPTEDFDLRLEPTPDLAYAFMHVALKDIGGAEIAQHTVGLQMQQAQAVQQQIEAQRLRQSLNLK